VSNTMRLFYGHRLQSQLVEAETPRLDTGHASFYNPHILNGSFIYSGCARELMKISEVRVIVTCPAGQTFVVVKIVTDSGVYGVGEGTKNGRELAVAALLEHHLA